NELFQKYALAACIKTALQLQGFEVGPPIAPQEPLPSNAVEEIRQALVSLEAIEQTATGQGGDPIGRRRIRATEANYLDELAAIVGAEQVVTDAIEISRSLRDNSWLSPRLSEHIDQLKRDEGKTLQVDAV